MSKKKLRVFEAFAGIGAQHAALKRLGLNFEIVGISEWFVNALICYTAIHCDGMKCKVPTNRDEILSYLSQFTFSKDSVKPCRLESLSEDGLRDLYRANKLTKNYGSISELSPSALPDMDLLVYSFPCQDLSTGGLGKGMAKGSGTRSGLLWEVERILNGLHDEDRLPEYLLLENVTTIKADSNISDLNQWLAYLESIGYYNDECLILNAQDFGVPQDRTRAFILSHLGSPLHIGTAVRAKQKPRKYNIHDFIKDDYDQNPQHRIEADIAQLNRTPSREVMWEINGMQITDSTVVRTITCNLDRTHCAALFPYVGAKGDTYRRPTMREAYLLMGFDEADYELTRKLNFSFRKMNKLIGNSIVVNVLEAIFDVLFSEKYCKGKPQ